MEVISPEELYSLYRDTLYKCQSKIFNYADDIIEMMVFEDFVIGQWGGIDLTIVPYSQATNGKVRLVVNAYFDAKPRRAEAFVAKTLEA